MSTDKKNKFPTEIVTLPSEGFFYPEDNPLSSGQVEIKYMTAREEDILTSRNLITKGIVIDKLLEAVVVGNGKGEKVNLDDLILGDKNAIMISTRILGYGSDYNFEITDPDTGEKFQDSVDLNALATKKLDLSEYEKGINKFNFKLPVSGKEIEFKLLTHKDEKEIDIELKKMQKFVKAGGAGSEITTRLKRAITSVDGDSDKGNIHQFVTTQFLSQDAKAFRTYMSSVTPDIDMTYNFINPDDGSEKEITVPMTVDFFWPKS
tara:strand:- start:1575 stop:2363 length:789 start_codon:yes stop_codon:yes gene_type:complete